MQRNLVQIARIQMRQIVPGDVVNRVPDDTRGWFVAGVLEELFDGNLQVASSDRLQAFSAGPLDIVGVQLLKPIELPVYEHAAPVVDVAGDAPIAEDPEEAEREAEPHQEASDPAPHQGQPVVPVPADRSSIPPSMRGPAQPAPAAASGSRSMRDLL